MNIFVWDDLVRFLSYSQHDINDHIYIGNNRTGDNMVLYGYVLVVLPEGRAEVRSYNKDWSKYTVVLSGDFDDLKWEIYYSIGNKWKIENPMTRKNFKEKFNNLEE